MFLTHVLYIFRKCVYAQFNPERILTHVKVLCGTVTNFTIIHSSS